MKERFVKMLKLRLLLRRIRSFSFGRMLVYVREVKKETKMPSFLIVLDMLLCIVLYNVGFFDYHIFGFVHIRTATAGPFSPCATTGGCAGS